MYYLCSPWIYFIKKALFIWENRTTNLDDNNIDHLVFIKNNFKYKNYHFENKFLNKNSKFSLDSGPLCFIHFQLELVSRVEFNRSDPGPSPGPVLRFHLYLTTLFWCDINHITSEIWGSDKTIFFKPNIAKKPTKVL